MNELKKVTYKNDLILTTEQLAEFYGTTVDRIKQNFRRNEEKFEAGKHYFLLEGGTLKDFKHQVSNSSLVAERTAHLYLWTKRGASRHSKMLGTDRAWEMFDELEENYFNPKQSQLDTTNLSPELQMFNGLFKALAKNELATKQLDSKVDSISEIVAVSTKDWKNETNHLINKIARQQGNTDDAHRTIRADIYADVDRRGGVSLNIRLTNLKRRMALEGASKTKLSKVNRVDVISQDKKLIEIYMAIVKEFAIKSGVWKDQY